MKIVILAAAALAFASTTAQAETQLACWNMHAKKGSAPILKANRRDGNALDIQINLKDEYFTPWIFDNSGVWDGTGQKTDRGDLAQPEQNLIPEEITTKRSPYVGNNQYSFTIGHEEFKLVNAEGVTTSEIEKGYGARLILPKDLSSDALKAFRIRTPQERSNAVAILNSSTNMEQGGDNYLRMFCISK